MLLCGDLAGRVSRGDSLSIPNPVRTLSAFTLGLPNFFCSSPWPVHNIGKMAGVTILQKASRSCMGIRELDQHDRCVPCACPVSAPNCFCCKHADQREMLTAASVITFNSIVRDIRRLPLSSTESSNKLDAAIDDRKEDIKDHLKTALCSIVDRTRNLKKRKEPPIVTQAEARRALRDSARLKR